MTSYRISHNSLQWQISCHYRRWKEICSCPCPYSTWWRTQFQFYLTPQKTWGASVITNSDPLSCSEMRPICWIDTVLFNIMARMKLVYLFNAAWVLHFFFLLYTNNVFHCQFPLDPSPLFRKTSGTRWWHSRFLECITRLLELILSSISFRETPHDAILCFFNSCSRCDWWRDWPLSSCLTTAR